MSAPTHAGGSGSDVADHGMKVVDPPLDVD